MITENMAIEGNHGFWGDLHRPDLNPNQTDFSVIGIPYDGLASARKGAALAPGKPGALAGPGSHQNRT